MAYLDKIDELGGMQAAIETGFAQREIHNSAYAYQKAIESGELTVVGVNEYAVEEEQQLETLRVDPAVGTEQRTRLNALRGERDGERVQETLRALRVAAEGDANLMPPILACVEACATLGEICDAMRKYLESIGRRLNCNGCVEERGSYRLTQIIT